jgi:hypothetical protein
LRHETYFAQEQGKFLPRSRDYAEEIFHRSSAKYVMALRVAAKILARGVEVLARSPRYALRTSSGESRIFASNATA